MEEINHFSHKNHPLKLVNAETVVADDNSGGGRQKLGVIGCYACRKPISSGFAYGCIQCHHFIHKSCAQLLPTVNLPSLYCHPLTLFDFGATNSHSWICYVCNTTKFGGFTYFFAKSEDNLYFNTCIDCCVVEIARKAEADAIKEEAKIKIEHEGHPHHTLTLQLRPAAFRCDACHVEDKDLLYICDNCEFWIHKTCASLDPTLDLSNHHNHQLILVYSLPEKFFKFAYYCEFCSIYIRQNDWLYHCPNCRYFAHIKCALNAQRSSTPRDGPGTSIANEDVDGFLHFPMSNAFTDPLKLLHFENIAQDYDKKIEIRHWSHNHPLVLTIDPKGNKMSDDQIYVCRGCVKPLSLPYYTCKHGCSFTLHKYCVELPLELEHRLHPDHFLTLKNIEGGGSYYKCIGCLSFGNTFFYVCETCNFYIDVSCAFLPNTIKHTSHKHPLIQVIDPKPLCNACNKWYPGISYTCNACNFILGMYCAMRSPFSLAHRYCKGHEIPLMYPPIMDHPEDFFCEVCEREMHPKFPQYYCHKCKNSFDRGCISRIVGHANIFLEGTITVPFHKHPLTYVRRKKTPGYVCSYCNYDINGCLVLECRARVCNFNICYDCYYDN